MGEIWNGYSGLMYKSRLPEGEWTSGWIPDLTMLKVIQISCENSRRNMIYKHSGPHFSINVECWKACYWEMLPDMSLKQREC